MKKLLAAIAAVGLLVAACTSTQQRVTYNTIGSLEAAATAGVDSYFTLVLKGNVSTNGIASVGHAYDAFQAAAKTATDATQFGTNALAPANLVTLANDLANTITKAKGQ